MIFKFGKYKNLFGPYQLADLLQHVGIHKDKCHQIGEWLSNTWVDAFCQWINSKRKQKIVVKVEPHDIWGMDYTLAQIIHPMLILLKEKKHGTPFVENCDIPEQFHKSYSENEKEIDGDWNEDGWNWIMDEMIFAFDQIKFDKDNTIRTTDGKYDWDATIAIENRIKNGTRLFGKYFQNLWD